MTDDEKTAESAAGLIPEPGERRDRIEQIRERHAGVHFVHPVNLAECDCSTCAPLAEIDRLSTELEQARNCMNVLSNNQNELAEEKLKLQAQLGAVVEECAAATAKYGCTCGGPGNQAHWRPGDPEHVGTCPLNIAQKLRSLPPFATKALERRVLDARREEAAHWHDSAELSAGCFVGVCPGCIRVAEIDAQIARLEKVKASDEQKPQCPKWELPSEEEQMLEEAAVTIQVAKEHREAVVAAATAQARLEEARAILCEFTSADGSFVPTLQGMARRIAALEAALDKEKEQKP